jgi:hypothetical protein
MGRTFQDHNFLVWEAYASGARRAQSDHANIAFHCLTDRSLRPRIVTPGGDNADAERIVATAEPAQLLELLKRRRK